MYTGMPLPRCTYSFCLVLLLACRTTIAANWPNGPFNTSTRWITDASGNIIQYAGVNWPGHVDSMVPEGLQYQSIASIVSRIKSVNLNSIRLTYAIQMIDEIQTNGGNDVPIRTSFIRALGQQNGSSIYDRVIQNNPSFNETTTRLDVFDAIAAECNRQQIYVHLDNHVSRAGWCCTPFDGNSWWGDTYFSVANWTRGLAYMADHGKSWPNLMSMSLRNELRQPLTNTTLFSQSYNWRDWYRYIQQGTQAIHNTNPNVLVFLSGLDSDTTLRPIVEQTALTPGTEIFNRSLVSPYPSKLALELHNYANIIGGGGPNYMNLGQDMNTAGLSALADNSTNPWPVVVTEFGFPINASSSNDSFVRAVTNAISLNRAGWQQWSLQGSYYIQEGKQDSDETWGLLNHDWSDWRAQQYINDILKPLINITLAVVGQSTNNSSRNNTGGSQGGGGGSSGSSGVLKISALLAHSLLVLWLLLLVNS